MSRNPLDTIPAPAPIFCDDDGWIPADAFREQCEQDGPLSNLEFAELQAVLCALGLEVRADGAVRYVAGYRSALLDLLGPPPTELPAKA